MKIEEVDGEPTHVFEVDEIYGVAKGVTPRGLAIEGRDASGDPFVLKIDLLQLVDVLAGLRDHLRANGQPAVGVMWSPEEDRVDVFSDGHGKPTDAGEPA